MNKQDDDQKPMSDTGMTDEEILRQEESIDEY